MTVQEVKDVPAFAGGTPAKTVPFGSEVRYGNEELEQLKEALAQGSLFYAHGKKVSQFEEDFRNKIGVNYAICTSSGTASIHAAMIAIGISPGDEVIVPPITDMGSLTGILFQGGVPVFADVDPLTWNMAPESVEQAITPHTKAVLAVHLWGNSCNLNALQDICRRHSILLIEDCAQAWGCEYDGKPVGTIGDIGCFSINEFKHISCGDGGVTITNDEQLGKRLRLATDKCYNREAGASMRNPIFLAANYRITELQAAVAIAQMQKLDSIVSRRRKWCSELHSRLKSVPGLILAEPTERCSPSWWFFPFRIDPDILGVNADEFAKAVHAEGITNIGAHYIAQCVYEYPIFTNHSAFSRGEHPYADRVYKKGLCPNAEKVLDTCLLFHVNQAYTDQDLDEATLAFTRVARWFAKG